MEELIENLNVEDMDYYYHITSKGFGADIIESGLYMEEKDLKSTTIKLNEDFFNNPEEYCKSEYKNGHVKRQEMVLISCYKGEEYNLINEVYNPEYAYDYKIYGGIKCLKI